MRTKVKVLSSEVVLDRLLEALGQELIDASDEEIIEAARSLGMDPKTRGSAAFAGLRYPAKLQLSDFFDLETCTKLRVAAEPIAGVTPTEPKRKAHQARRAALATPRKDPADK
jgi:hypothetical protein